MNVIDSSAWIAYFKNERSSEVLLPPLADLDDLLVPSITLAEVFRYTARVRDSRTAMRLVAQMRQGRVISLDDTLAIEAARFGLQFKLPLADSIIYATARRFDATLWTRDADFEGLAGVQFF